MATWVSLVNFTDQGIRNIKDSPDRLAAFRRAAEEMGVNVKSVWYTVGRHDLVTVVEGADESVTTLLLKLGALGNVRSQTMRAFTPEEIKGMVSKLG